MFRKTLNVLKSALALALMFTSGLASQAQTSYSFRDLGTLGGPYSYPNGVNSAAQVVGAAMWSPKGSNLTRDVHAFFWSASTGMRDLGTLGGLSSIANSINSGGEVVGQAEYNPAVFDYHAFYWTSGTGLVDLNSLLDPTLRTTWTLQTARDINDNHQIVGIASVNNSGTMEQHSYRLDLSNNTLTDLGTGFGAVSLNAVGQIVGGGYLYNSGFPLISLSPMSATQINNAGAMSGTVNTYNAAYRAPNGTITDLGRFGGSQSHALSINNALTPVVVGMSDIIIKNVQYIRAFRWRPGDASLTNLNNITTNLGKNVLRYATKVSDTGYIVGRANSTNFESPLNDHAYLLTPNP